MGRRMDLSQLVIRDFAMEDYSSLIDLWVKAGLPHKPRGRDRRERIEEELQGEAAVFVIAEFRGRLVGSAFGTHDGRKGWINRVAVAPEWRRRGIGRMLVRAVEERLEKKGIEIIAALIETWNVASMDAFKRMGYRKHEDVLYFTKRKHDEV